MSSRSTRASALVAAAVVAAWAGDVSALNRVALVIGNSNYVNEPHLVNPSRDAQAVADALRKAGFESVKEITDADVVTLNHALHDFQDQALGSDVAVLYYAGHGLELNGKNYLIPVDAKLKADRDLSYEAVPQNLAQEAAGGARLLSLVVLDACRDNPFAAQMTITSGGSRSISRGLAPVNEEDLSVNSIIEYAAQSGTTASDGDPAVGHSPFASSFINHIGEPGVEITLLFGKVRDDVWKITNKSQRPASYGSHGGDPVYLVPPNARTGFATASTARAAPVASTAENAAMPSRALVAEPPSAQDLPNILPDLEAWQKVIGAADPAAIQRYLNRFPDARYAAIARRRLAALAADPNTGSALESLNKGFALARNQDPEGAARMYAAAAATGSAAGEYWLASSYQNGRGVPKDLGKAVDLYRASAKQGYAPAEVSLGRMLEEGGYGAAPDYGSAKMLYETAAADGSGSAMNSLAILYSLGRGVPQDRSKALQLYRMSAATGAAAALSNMGLAHSSGRLLPQDFIVAAKWYEAAADRGSVAAEVSLGRFYFQGRGVERDPAKARVMMSKAAAQGNSSAIDWLKLNPG